MLKDGTRQMDENWILKRLEDEVDSSIYEKIAMYDYEPWVLVVDETGEVVKIHELDKNAKVIKTIKP